MGKLWTPTRRKLLLSGASLIACPALLRAQIPMTGAGLGTPASSGYSPAAQQYITRLIASGDPGTTIKNYMATFIDALVTAGNPWTLADTIRVFSMPTAANALLNVKGTLHDPATLSGTPTFTANTGYNGFGNTTYIQDNLNPVADAGTCNYVQNSCARFFWTLDTGITGGGFGQASGNSFVSYSSPTATYRVQCGSSDTVVVDGDQHWYGWSRTGANNYDMYAANTPHNQTLLASSVVVNGIFKTGLQDDFFNVFTKNIAFTWNGGGLTTTEASALYTAAHALMQNLAGAP